ncbi:hypothetical protein HDV00_012736 [Rhizophlyctis rosea]|nr:hypothetical protein HDV00_012736 [Rhizophlyctis rosea]
MGYGFLRSCFQGLVELPAQSGVRAGEGTDAYPSFPRLIIPSDTLYDVERQGYQLRTQHFPVAIFYPRSSVEASAAVRCATSTNTTIVPRGGGHSYEGLSSQNATLVIDVEKMDAVLNVQAIDATNGIATVQSGIRTGPLYKQIYEQGGWGFNAGICLTMGVAGHVTSGGGWGVTSRNRGYASDNVVSFEVVLVDGSIVTANETSYQDLFWALRGGGAGSFGVITKLQLKVFRPLDVSLFAIDYAIDKVPQVFNIFQRWGPSAPPQFGMMIQVNQRVGVTTARVQGLHEGPLAELQQLLDASNLLGIAQNYTVTDKCSILGARVFLRSDFTCSENSTQFALLPRAVDRGTTKQKSAYTNRLLPFNVLEDITNFAKNGPVGTGMQFKLFSKGQQPRAPYLHTPMLDPNDMIVQIGYSINTAIEEPMTGANMTYTHDFERKLVPFTDRHAYQGYADTTYQGSPYLWAYYGKNAAKLIQIKQKYDPENFFRNGQSIPVRPPLEVLGNGSALSD